MKGFELFALRISDIGVKTLVFKSHTNGSPLPQLQALVQLSETAQEAGQRSVCD